MRLSVAPYFVALAIACSCTLAAHTASVTTQSVPERWRGPLPLRVEWRVTLSIEGEGRLPYVAELTRTQRDATLSFHRQTSEPSGVQEWQIAGKDDRRIVALAEAFESITLDAAPKGAIITDGSFVHMFFESAGGTWYRLDFGVAGPSRPDLPPIARWALEFDQEVQQRIVVGKD